MSEREMEVLMGEMRDALARLTLEAIHYRNTGIGAAHLNVAIANAETVLEKYPV